VTDANSEQLRVLHVVSPASMSGPVQSALFMPLLTRLPKQHVEAEVVCLAAGLVPAAVLRQSGVPVHEVALSRRRFALRSFRELLRIVREFRPDVIQAWGHTAQIVSVWLSKRCEHELKLLWSVANTTPLARHAGWIDRRKLALLVKRASLIDRIVYASHAGAAQHRSAGFPDEDESIIPPGVDAARFKPDPRARERMRERLELDPDAFVIGMVAPFQPESDHSTFLKAMAELLKHNANITVVLAGQGASKNNAALVAQLGSGALGSRVRLLGEWSDLAAFFNTCDLACSSALNDGAAVTLAMAMLCGVPCVATGLGAQGEVIGTHGIAIEPGNPAALVRGVNRFLQLTPEKRAAMAHGARKHALKNFVVVRSMQHYLQLYYELSGRPMPQAQTPPAPPADVAEPVPAAATSAPAPATKKKTLTVEELADPDSLEDKVSEIAEPLPKWRVEQEEQRARWEQELSRQIAAADQAADVLQAFEAEAARRGPAAAAETEERARGVAEDIGDLLPAEVLETPVLEDDDTATHPQPSMAKLPQAQLDLLGEPSGEASSAHSGRRARSR
jgi:glycosyltransferase involved in cell wall biosynthesis